MVQVEKGSFVADALQIGRQVSDSERRAVPPLLQEKNMRTDQKHFIFHSTPSFGSRTAILFFIGSLDGFYNEYHGKPVWHRACKPELQAKWQKMQPISNCVYKEFPYTFKLYNLVERFLFEEAGGIANLGNLQASALQGFQGITKVPPFLVMNAVSGKIGHTKHKNAAGLEAPLYLPEHTDGLFYMLYSFEADHSIKRVFRNRIFFLDVGLDRLEAALARLFQTRL